jgi:hypothetical protein
MKVKRIGFGFEEGDDAGDEGGDEKNLHEVTEVGESIGAIILRLRCS